MSRPINLSLAHAFAGVGLVAVVTLIHSGAHSDLLAQEYDYIREGHDLVTMYCADCHATETAGQSPLPTAPQFRDLHLRYDVEFLSEALVEGIVTAHPEMPQFEFDPDQAASIIAYLKTLEPRPAEGQQLGDDATP